MCACVCIYIYICMYVCMYVKRCSRRDVSLLLLRYLCVHICVLGSMNTVFMTTTNCIIYTHVLENKTILLSCMNSIACRSINTHAYKTYTCMLLLSYIKSILCRPVNIHTYINTIHMYTIASVHRIDALQVDDHIHTYIHTYTCMQCMVYM